MAVGLSDGSERPASFNNQLINCKNVDKPNFDIQFGADCNAPVAFADESLVPIGSGVLSPVEVKIGFNSCSLAGSSLENTTFISVDGIEYVSDLIGADVFEQYNVALSEFTKK